ncbi:MAG: threonine synthase [Gemmatimonadota bacterium]|nr:threonine synthase [Gemmatimonadota bacterium]
MIRFVSTSGTAPPVGLAEAIGQALAPDGGLYLPEPLVPFSSAEVNALRGRPLVEVGQCVLTHLLRGCIHEALLEAIVREALDFPIPLVRVSERIFALELFHGPTLAFKDVGARFLARLLAAVAAPASEPLTVLVATSGDTGGAVAHAVHGVEGTRVVVLYPLGQVSPVQERQFTTVGGNVLAVAVRGTFDDCQRLVKDAFADTGLRQRVRLTSANSINVGRLLPQVFYYFHGWGQLPDDSEPIVSVPSGNFGNLTAGLIAKRLGLPITRFVAATNANDVVPAYLRTGRYEPRPSERTISSAMDVGTPGNFARMMVLYDDDLERLRRDVAGHAQTDADTRACITRVWQETGYVLDPHSAVAYLGLEAEMAHRADAVGMLLVTAHPAKFADVVQPLIGDTVQVPDRLAALVARNPEYEIIAPSLDSLIPVLVEPR